MIDWGALITATGLGLIFMAAVIGYYWCKAVRRRRRHEKLVKFYMNFNKNQD